uniref:Uncharacterized protein n=1 Tax=Strigamia maritima TaxID=126957 RepID=T1J1F6_STRMM
MKRRMMWILFLTVNLLAFGRSYSLANERMALNDEMNFDANNQDDDIIPLRNFESASNQDEVIIPLKNYESASNQDEVIIPLKNYESASNQDEVVIPLMSRDETGKLRDKRWWGLAAKVAYQGAKIGRKLYCRKKPNSRICGKK